MAVRSALELRKGPRGFSHATLRLRELERIIRDRHGVVQDTDDADAYVEPAALCLRRLLLDRGRQPTVSLLTDRLTFWCTRWAPAFAASVPAMAARVCASKATGIGKADAIGCALRLSDADRTRLCIRTIGSYDVDRRAREKRRRERKRQRDKERARLKRAAEGAKTRAEYLAGCLSQAKPWEAMGISRRTFERRRKAAERRDAA